MPTGPTFKMTSPAFEDGGLLPVRYTCDGEDVNPPLSIFGVPAGARSLVLIMDDPDASAGTFTHWVVFNILPTVMTIEERANKGYLGPCPPSGVHHYVFTLYALDIILSLSAGAIREEVEEAMEGHVIGKTRLVGLYGRSAE